MQYEWDTSINLAELLRYTPDNVAVLYNASKWTGEPTDADMTDEWANNGGPDGYGAGGLCYSCTGGPDFSGPHAGGHDILFADWHVKVFAKWGKGEMTRHAQE